MSELIATYLAKDLTDLRRSDEIAFLPKYIALGVVALGWMCEAKLHVSRHGYGSCRLPSARFTINQQVSESPEIHSDGVTDEVSQV
jgi:hypothetical protein